MDISVVIPAYNEEKRIGLTLEKVQDYLDGKKWDYEIIVVDDGSIDKTVEVVKSFANARIRLLQNPKNMGKGYTVRHGMLKAQKDYVLFSDADLSTPINELDQFDKVKGNYDILIGSRRLRQSSIPVKQPFYRRWPGAVFPLLVSLLVIKGIRDTQCGFKMFRRDTAYDLFKRQTLHGFSFDAEILYLAQKHDYSIKEMPVVWVNALDSKLNAVTDSYRMFIELLKIRHNDIKGMYK
jgi:dolichyl-phosphate beta-glucosyltransferase